MKITELKLEHWLLAFGLFATSVVAWTVLSHYTEKWLTEHLDS